MLVYTKAKTVNTIYLNYKTQIQYENIVYLNLPVVSLAKVLYCMDFIKIY